MRASQCGTRTASVAGRSSAVPVRAADDCPTEPAPAVHSYYAPKFPPDPKLPEVDEAMLEELELMGERDYPSGVQPTFRTAPVLKHVYQHAEQHAEGECGAKSA